MRDIWFLSHSLSLSPTHTLTLCSLIGCCLIPAPAYSLFQPIEREQCGSPPAHSESQNTELHSFAHTGLNDQRFVLSCTDSVQHNNKTTTTCLELSREYTSARSNIPPPGPTYLRPVQHTSTRSNIPPPCPTYLHLVQHTSTRPTSDCPCSSDPGSIL